MPKMEARELRLELGQLEEMLKKAGILKANEYLNDAHIEPNELVLRILIERR